MIQTENLSKKYARFAAVENLNLVIRQGTIFGLVGENGAGKTTALSMLATLTSPSSGRAYVNGFEISRQPDQVRRTISYMPDSFGVYDDLNVDEYLQFYSDCYEVPRSTAVTRRDELLEWVGLQEQRRTFVNVLSRGMQQRLEIARCLMHDPQVLILDEPSSGLDPRARIDMRAVLSRLRSLGKTVVVSSHILSELGEFADEIGVMRAGQLVTVASVQVMLSQSTAHRRLWLVGNAEPAGWESILRQDSHVLEVRPASGGVEILYGGTLDQQADLMRLLLEAGVRLTQFAERPTDIEELFLRLTERKVGLA